MKLKKKLYQAGESAVSMLKWPGISRKIDLGYESLENSLEMKKAEAEEELNRLQVAIAKGNTSIIASEVSKVLEIEELENQIKVLRARKSLLDGEAPNDENSKGEEE